VSKIEEGVQLDHEESAVLLRGLLEPVMGSIKAQRKERAGIVMVVHRPGRLTLQALKKAGVPIKHLKKRGTTVFGTTCEGCAAVFGHDLVTRGWAATPPAEGETKIFLMSGNGSLLITMSEVEGGRVRLHVEPDFIGPVGRA
jgi:hypothetical protein